MAAGASRSSDLMSLLIFPALFMLFRRGRIPHIAYVTLTIDALAFFACNSSPRQTYFQVYPRSLSDETQGKVSYIMT